MEIFKNPSAKRIAILLAIFFLVLIAYFSKLFAPAHIQVDIGRQSIKKSNYHFIYEHWLEDRLTTLRDAEDYKDIKAQGQFDLFLRLCDWVNRQWPRSVPDPYPLCNAIDILHDIRTGKTGGFCGQYAYVLADVLKSLGFFSVRYVELWGRGQESHFVIEVWSDQFEKWVILDPDHNLYYELAGKNIPANAYEVHAALFSGSPVGARSASAPHTGLGQKKTGLYANFAVSLRSDLLRHTRPLTVNDRFRMFLFYKDDHWGSDYFAGQIPYAQVTSRAEDLYFDCNCVRADYRASPDGKSVTFELFTDNSMPNFKAFALSGDGGKTWQQFAGNTFTVGRKQGRERSIIVAPVNMFDRLGCLTRIGIRFRRSPRP